MTTSELPMEWPALLVELRKLNGLIAPLQALLAQEAAPGLSDRIDRFLAEITRVGDQVERAAEAMAAERQNQDVLRQMVQEMHNQRMQLTTLQGGMTQILDLLGQPLGESSGG